MPDSSAIDNALIALLGADATLLSYCTNGVYWDEAPPNSTKFVIVSFVDQHDEPMFNATAFEDGLYLVKAVMLSTAGGDVKAAADRIQTLLHQQPLTVAGYGVSVMRRDSRVRMTEVDEVDSSIRWFHRGGNYQVVASATP
jgi:hypothetical protein